MDKPIIKHCRNCAFCKKSSIYYFPKLYCDVCYKEINYPRIRAILCQYFVERKEDENDSGRKVEAEKRI